MRTVLGTSKRFVALLAGMAICGVLTAPVKAAGKDKAPAAKAKAAPAGHEKTGAGIHVTPAQVQQMAAKYIQPDKATIVVVGDKKVIADQVAPYEKAS